MKKIVIILVLIGVFAYINPITAYSHTIGDIDFNSLFENHAAIMLLIDSQTGEIEHANKAAADFYGYTIEQIESMNIREMNTLSSEEVKKEMQAALMEQRNHFIFKHRIADGSIKTVEVYSCPHVHRDKTLLFSTIYDITVKTQLAEKNETLLIVLFVALLSIITFAGIFSLLSYENKKRLEKSNFSLKASEDSLRLILDSAAEAIYGIDTDGSCTFCNISCLKMLGYSNQDDLIGRNMHWQIHYKRSDGTELPLNECQIFKSFTKGEGSHVEDDVLWRADGTCFPAEYYSYPQYQNGSIVGAVVTFTDITERKLSQNQIIKYNEELENANRQLHEKQYLLEEQNATIEELNSQLEDDNERIAQQKETLQAIIDSLGAGVIMVDLEGKITFVNEAWKELFSYHNYSDRCNLNDNFYIKDSFGNNTETFIQNMMIGIENSNEIYLKLLELTTDRISRYTVDLEQTSPVRRFLNLYSNPCISYKNHNFGRVFVIRDISHQKEVDRLKMELISTVSHELRTPMSSVLGFSELLLTRRLSEDRRKEYIRTINSEAKRLTDLINDFLDIQRMESGKQVFNKQFNSLDDIIKKAVRLFENIDKHTIIFNNRLNNSHPIYCDKDKILQVLFNFLSNAIKYSPEGGEINIELIKLNETIKVSVTDYGLGIPEDVIDKLFTKFFRVDNDDRRKIGGTGLGLAICKEIIKAHGGDIGVETVYGQGSTFYFTLPCSENKNKAYRI